MFNPVATYRIQFHKNFSFKDFESIITYLKKLGVSTVYASPVFAAVPGSVHGYDGINPHQINEEIGTEDGLRNISQQLKEAQIHWLQDIVPNHMAFDPKNEWLMDVLEKGKRSVYANLFDVLWESKVYNGRIMVPFLGKPLTDAINEGELKIAYANNRFVFQYYAAIYPLHPNTYYLILAHKKTTSRTVKDLLHQLKNTLSVEDANALHEQWKGVLELVKSFAENPKNRAIIENCCNAINEDKELLKRIAEEQEYQLCFWQETDYHINYRRFFTVNGLICLNIQHDDVFRFYHQCIKKLTDEAIFQGLRVDHIDGLYDPAKYLNQLRDLAGGEAYITVEKILQQGEQLPDHWPIEGNTGYDFLSMANNLLTQKNNEQKFTLFYQQFTGDRKSIQQHVHDKKSLILYEHMKGELDNLYHLFLELKLADKKELANIHPDDLKDAIDELLVQCPVYRYYPTSLPLQHNDEHALQIIFQKIRKSGFSTNEAVHVLEQALLHKPHEDNTEYNERALQFYRRCMQFTGPLMAKGVEDTLMYTYHRFIAHNEVGDTPESFGMDADTFHKLMQERLAHWPLSMNATATHDTKRGEDFRAFLNVLSDVSEEWLNTVREWHAMNASLKTNNIPDPNDEYFIYQTMVGSYPLNEQDEHIYASRLEQYLEKTLREAKIHSNWTAPNTEYEAAVKKFAIDLLDKSQPFWQSFTAFRQKIIDHGIVNSLTQLVLKFTCPGVPDTYQGCELWDFSFVDPDNRRPVNYEQRIQWLDDFQNENFPIEELWNWRHDGRIKLWLTQQLLKLRKLMKDVFTEGEYIPLRVEGTYKNNVIAFARKYRQNFYVVALPLHSFTISNEQQKSFLEIDWKDTRILLPKKIKEELQNILSGERTVNKRGLYANSLFKKLPFAILKAQQSINERGAGVLMHVTSLPSGFGIGDLGPEAKSFVDFLYNCRQKYWQLLPINPTEGGQGHSPYSATSSKGGNTLLISPEWLMAEGFLTADDLQPYYLPSENHVLYADAERIKKELLQKAFDSFNSANNESWHSQFDVFCNKESEWLDDFAFYSLLKEQNSGKPWYEWSEEFKRRDEGAMNKLSAEFEMELNKIKFLQFIFFKQWNELKKYCNERNILLIGDLPFYISYDSTDVWAHKELFAIDENGNRTGMAGVPPDAFSTDGQLWGMPVFKWEKLKETNYDWWIKRLKKNIELFDIVRLDHFRAFAAYWEVPAGETTAKNGTWKDGPGIDFFHCVETTLGTLPFVAEDLGDIDEHVLELRDAFDLPGMKILQFAFGDDMPQSDYIPHNYTQNFIVYTGTHDNNTIRGWYTTEVSDIVRLRVEGYAGRPLSAAEIHLELARLAYASVANIVILPLQDVLGLDESARMNTPASGENNWSWRLQKEQSLSVHEERLRKWTRLYNRE